MTKKFDLSNIKKDTEDIILTATWVPSHEELLEPLQKKLEKDKNLLLRLKAEIINRSSTEDKDLINLLKEIVEFMDDHLSGKEIANDMDSEIISEMFISEGRIKVQKFRDQYYKDHKLCPKCRSTHHNQDYGPATVLQIDSPETYVDICGVKCLDCNWTGIVDDLIK